MGEAPGAVILAGAGPPCVKCPPSPPNSECLVSFARMLHVLAHSRNPWQLPTAGQALNRFVSDFSLVTGEVEV